MSYSWYHNDSCLRQSLQRIRNRKMIKAHKNVTILPLPLVTSPTLVQVREPTEVRQQVEMYGTETRLLKSPWWETRRQSHHKAIVRVAYIALHRNPHIDFSTPHRYRTKFQHHRGQESCGELFSTKFEAPTTSLFSLKVTVISYWLKFTKKKLA